MSREQWGHGYHAGVAAGRAEKRACQNSTEFIKKFFHSFKEDGKLKWQGRLISIKNGIATIQLIDWWDGFTTEKRKIDSAEMIGWKFYASAAEMREAYYEIAGYEDWQIKADKMMRLR